MHKLLIAALAAFALTATAHAQNQDQTGAMQGQTDTQMQSGQTNQTGEGTQGTATDQTQQAGQTQTGQTQAGQAQAGQGGGQMRAGMSREDMVASQQRVMKVLSDAGLSDVRILDAAYLVQATTPQNEMVMMIVNSSGQPVRPQMGGQPGAMQGQN